LPLAHTVQRQKQAKNLFEGKGKALKNVEIRNMCYGFLFIICL